MPKSISHAICATLSRELAERFDLRSKPVEKSLFVFFETHDQPFRKLGKPRRHIHDLHCMFMCYIIFPCGMELISEAVGEEGLNFVAPTEYARKCAATTEEFQRVFDAQEI